MNYQNTNNDCGKCSSRNLLRIIYSSKDYEAAYFDDETMTNFLSMQKGLRKYGVETKGFEVDKEDFDNLKRPFIAQIRKGDDDHFIVVKKGKKRLKIIDSSVGKIYIKKEEFFRYFTGNVLEVKKAKEKEKPKVNLFTFKEYLPYLLYSFLEMLLLIVGVFLTTLYGDVLYLALGSLASILLSLLKRNFTLSLNQKVDNRLLIPYLSLSKDEKKYEILMKIKNKYFLNLSTIINQMEMILILAILAAIEDLYLFIGILIVIVLTYLFSIYISPKLKSFELEADIKEQKMRFFLVNEFEKNKALKYYGQQKKIGRKYTWYYYLLRFIPFLSAVIYTAIMLILKEKLTFEALAFNVGYLILLIRAMIRLDEVSYKSDRRLSSLVDFEDYKLFIADKENVVTCPYLDKKDDKQ